MAHAEDRQVARRKSLKRARLIREGSGGIGIECLVVDINSRGARLRFGAPLATGPEVQLLFIPEHVTASAWVVWQNGSEIGVEFTRPLPWLRNLDMSNPVSRHPREKPAGR
ncbi:PilZ domain-containing protein [Ensifer sp. NBAIM29]|nr:PilZ domain-containing protein [Ensifer sp. NBAIM29]